VIDLISRSWRSGVEIHQDPIALLKNGGLTELVGYLRLVF